MCSCRSCSCLPTFLIRFSVWKTVFCSSSFVLITLCSPNAYLSIKCQLTFGGFHGRDNLEQSKTCAENMRLVFNWSLRLKATIVAANCQFYKRDRTWARSRAGSREKFACSFALLPCSFSVEFWVAQPAYLDSSELIWTSCSISLAYYDCSTPLLLHAKALITIITTTNKHTNDLKVQSRGKAILRTLIKPTQSVSIFVPKKSLRTAKLFQEYYDDTLRLIP